MKKLFYTILIFMFFNSLLFSSPKETDIIKWKQPIFILILLIITFFLSCSESPTDNNPCPPIQVVSQPPFHNPIWHPSNNFIGFNYTPLNSITYPYGENCVGTQHFDYDSSGFWLINPDGTNLRKVLPYQLFLATWSPDGEWIAFVQNAQIYKMPFNIEGEGFDATRIEQLTFEGNNFSPAWSPNQIWIAFDSNYDSPNGGYRIWKMKTDGTNKSFVVNGRMPYWTEDSKAIIYIGLYSELFKVDVNDTSDVTKITHLNETDIYNTDNRNPRFSPTSSEVAFWSNGTIWQVDENGENLKQIKNNLVDVDFGLPFSWSPNGEKIVYSRHNGNNWGYDNGVLWIINVESGTEYQLTFNTAKK